MALEPGGRGPPRAVGAGGGGPSRLGPMPGGGGPTCAAAGTAEAARMAKVSAAGAVEAR